MIGNDVVDLGDPDSDAGTLSPRFDQRVFGAAEQRRLLQSPQPARERWRLWAAKEAAYKLARKLDPGTVFAPLRFAVELASCGEPGECAGTVRHGAALHRLQICEGVDYVHAVVIPAAGSSCVTLTGLHRLRREETEDDCALAPGRAVRRLCVEAIAARLGLDTMDFEVRKQERVPRLYWRGRPAEGIDLSLSHHGGFVAFAFAFARVATGAGRAA
jgi:4'-phosphopantetheinyl transferase superfamily